MMSQATEGGSAGANGITVLRRLRQALHPLVACSRGSEDAADRERAELLASLLLALFVLGLSSGFLQWLLIPNFWPTFAAMLMALGVIGAAYFASRSRHFRRAAWAAAIVSRCPLSAADRVCDMRGMGRGTRALEPRIQSQSCLPAMLAAEERSRAAAVALPSRSQVSR